MMKVNDGTCLPPISEGVEFWENPSDALKNYDQLGDSGSFPQSVVDNPDTFIELLDEEGVEKVVLHGEDSGAKDGIEIPNEPLSEFASEYPDRLYPMSGCDPHRGESAVDRLEYAFSELGMRGAVIQPMMSGLPADHDDYFKIYEKCEEHNALVWIHSSLHHLRDTSLYATHPKHLDAILRSFPDMTVIAGHGGWPWVTDLIALMWKYDNLYFDISAWRPKYLAKQGTGWEPLIQYGNTFLNDRILFGSNWPTFGSYDGLITEFENTLAEVLSEDTQQKWLYENLNNII